MKPDKILSYIGIAKKGGYAKSGTFQTEEAVKSGKAFLVIIAEDASDNTKKKFMDMCDNYEVPYRFYSESEMLGHSMGNEFRMCLAITDEGLGKAIVKAMDF